MALLYLINKPKVFGGIARWLLLFLGFDFIVVDKLGKQNSIADALSRNPNSEPIVGILDNTVNAHLFTISTDELDSVVDYLFTGTFPTQMPARNANVSPSRPFRFISKITSSTKQVKITFPVAYYPQPSPTRYLPNCTKATLGGIISTIL